MKAKFNFWWWLARVYLKIKWLYKKHEPLINRSILFISAIWAFVRPEMIRWQSNKAREEDQKRYLYEISILKESIKILESENELMKMEIGECKLIESDNTRLREQIVDYEFAFLLMVTKQDSSKAKEIQDSLLYK